MGHAIFARRKGGTQTDEILVRGDSKEDAVDTVEKKVNAAGLDLIDHRTYALQYEPKDAIGSGKYAYKMTVTTRPGRNKQLELPKR